MDVGSSAPRLDSPHGSTPPSQTLVRTSENRPSTALIAIGAFILVMITGATALMYAWQQPKPAPVVKIEAPPAERS